MKLLLFIGILILLTVWVSPVFAVQSVDQVIGKVSPPPQITNFTGAGGTAGLSNFLTNVIKLIFMVSAIAFLFMVVLGAFQWLTSGGDKEAISKARSRIVTAIVGIALLAVAFFIMQIVGQLLGFQFFGESPRIFPTQVRTPTAEVQECNRRGAGWSWDGFKCVGTND
jgi:hypothetical protein